MIRKEPADQTDDASIPIHIRTSYPAPITSANNQFSTILLADLILTGMIAYGLWRSKTGWKDTDAMIKRIIM